MVTFEAALDDGGPHGLDRVDDAQPVLFAVIATVAAQRQALRNPTGCRYGSSWARLAASQSTRAHSLRDAVNGRQVA